MTGSQLILLAAAGSVLLAAAICEDQGWLAPGRPRTAMLVAAGAAVPVLLSMAGIPPRWFDGSAVGFSIGAVLLVAALLNRSAAERSFRWPFLGTLGATTIVLNLIANERVRVVSGVWMRNLFALSLLLCLSCRAEKPGPAPRKPVVAVPVPVTRSTELQSKDLQGADGRSFSFEHAGVKFHVSYSGLVSASDGHGFQLPTDDLPGLEALHLMPYGRDELLLIYEISDGDYGAGRIVRVDMPSRTIRLVMQIPGFNVGPAALAGKSLYVSAVGFVGALDVEAGKYEWTHETLYEKAALTAFGEPLVFEDRVEFPEATTEPRKRRVIVNRATGAIALK